MYRFPSYTEISSFRNVLIDQRESSCCTLSDGKLTTTINIYKEGAKATRKSMVDKAYREVDTDRR